MVDELIKVIELVVRRQGLAVLGDGGSVGGSAAGDGGCMQSIEMGAAVGEDGGDAKGEEGEGGQPAQHGHKKGLGRRLEWAANVHIYG